MMSSQLQRLDGVKKRKTVLCVPRSPVSFPFESSKKSRSSLEFAEFGTRFKESALELELVINCDVLK